jgi:hypothetical protein
MSPEQNHSGRVTLRLPKSLHGELIRAAAAEGVSVNRFMIGALAVTLGWNHRTANQSHGSTSRESVLDASYEAQLSPGDREFERIWRQRPG